MSTCFAKFHHIEYSSVIYNLIMEDTMNGMTILEPTFVDLDVDRKKKNKKFNKKKINELIDKIKDSIPAAENDKESNLR